MESQFPYERALVDHFEGRMNSDLFEIRNGQERDVFPIEVLFRTKNELIELEDLALTMCQGKILDVGAGAGTHSLILQSEGQDVTAVEFVPAAADIMKKRGVEKIAQQDFYKLDGDESYDTLLMLMNGTGIASDLPGFGTLLQKCERLISQEGHLIIDSTDLRTNLLPDGDVYYGTFEPGYSEVIKFQWEYDGEVGASFDWLYMDETCLVGEAEKYGWHAQIAYTDGDGHFLARMVKG